MEPRNLKKLAPAPVELSSCQDQPQVSVSVPGPRKNLTRNCDGNRPTCGRCQKNGDICVYEVNKRDIVKLQLLSDHDTARLQSFEVVFEALHRGTDDQAAKLLAQIRLGESIESLASTLSPNTKPSTSTSSNQPLAASSSDSPITHDGPETLPMTTTSQSYLDLLYDRDGWIEPVDSVDGDSDQVHPEE
ncbi:hypothetical protein F5Y04DRAFT_280750 [Hypomontagnella monticulosa]|nr:hypothetical protein F5Y04DRAFT_280750 [Hypomontagnella monticulosa]